MCQRLRISLNETGKLRGEPSPSSLRGYGRIVTFKIGANQPPSRTHRERKEKYTKDIENEVLRLKGLFTSTAKERDVAIRERDEAIRERDAAVSERQAALDEIVRLRDLVQAAASSSSSGGDSGYEGLSSSSDPSLSKSDSNTTSLETLPDAQPDGATEVPPLSVFEMCETRPPLMDEIAVGPPETTATVNGSQLQPLVPVGNGLTASLSPPNLDYDELGLDFVLT